MSRSIAMLIACFALAACSSSQRSLPFLSASPIYEKLVLKGCDAKFVIGVRDLECTSDTTDAGVYEAKIDPDRGRATFRVVSLPPKHFPMETVFGFDRCFIWDAKNWACTRTEGQARGGPLAYNFIVENGTFSSQGEHSQFSGTVEVK